ncbi:MAG: hypothetical protein HY815_33435 [Candidatus Riflebacteria bacterium]|nr:hypothetical protein [Candidatus Riflebacteria bacterium]
MGYLESIENVLTRDFSTSPREVKDRTARDVIEICSLACAGLTLQPIPGIEQAIGPIQAGMVLAVAHVFGQEITRKRAREIVMDLAAITGVNIVGRQVLLTLTKLVLPGLGGVLTAPYAFSVTWATGHAAVHYLASGGRPDRERIRKVFEEERERSKAHYSEEKAKANRPSEKENPRR